MTNTVLSPIFLNHFYLVLDSQTYRDIESSEFLRKQFAPAEVRRTRRTDITYTGLYFYGTQTYFEFFDEIGGISTRPGDLAIAFGIESQGDTEQLEQLLSTQSFVVTRPFEGIQVPWFKMLNLIGNEAVKLWTMEYLPTFLDEWHPQPSHSNETTRQSILERYKQIITPLEKPLFQDVLSLTIAVEKEIAETMAAYGKQFGYAIGHTKEGITLQLPQNVTIHLKITEKNRGIQEIMFLLNYVLEQETYRFGSNSVLEFLPEAKAVWRF